MSDNKTMDALNKVCAELPSGWTITIELERDAGNVFLYDEGGAEHEFPCNRERLLHDVLDALAYAIDHEFAGDANHD